jgi:TRAP-type C4-dicarboxylate transport system permease small subunit
LENLERIDNNVDIEKKNPVKPIETSFLGKISNTFERITIFLLTFIVGALFIDLVVAVFSRYLFGFTIAAADEVALFLLAWMTFLGASLAVKRNEMVAVTFLVERLGKFSWILQIVIQMVIILFSLLLMGYGYKWVSSPAVAETIASASQVPMWVPYLIFPVSMILTCIFSVDNIFKITKDRKETSNID